MKTLKYLGIAAIMIVFAACKGGGSGSSSGSMSPVSEKIQGPLGAYFEIVSKDYKAIDGHVSIEIKRIKEGFPAPWEDGMEVGYTGGEFEPHFTIEFQDEDGNVVSKGKTDIVYDEEDLKAIAALGVDETATITFNLITEECKASKFKMGSTFEVHEAEDDSSNSSDDSGDSSISSDDNSDDDTGSYSSSSSGSQDWDALLNSYEQYVDKYISCVKKAAKGDMSAMSEYPALMEKAQEFSDKMEGAQGDMSASQWARYMRITNKMAKAAQQM